MNRSLYIPQSQPILSTLLYSCGKALAPDMAIFEEKAFKRVIEANKRS